MIKIVVKMYKHIPPIFAFHYEYSSMEKSSKLRQLKTKRSFLITNRPTPKKKGGLPIISWSPARASGSGKKLGYDLLSPVPRQISIWVDIPGLQLNIDSDKSSDNVLFPYFWVCGMKYIRVYCIFSYLFMLFLLKSKQYLISRATMGGSDNLLSTTWPSCSLASLFHEKSNAFTE